MKPLLLAVLVLCPLPASAQLAVTVSPVKVTGQKAIVPLTMKNVGYDVERDFTPVARVGGTPMLIAANAKFAPGTLSEVVQSVVIV